MYPLVSVIVHGFLINNSLTFWQGLMKLLNFRLNLKSLSSIIKFKRRVLVAS